MIPLTTFVMEMLGDSLKKSQLKTGTVVKTGYRTDDDPKYWYWGVVVEKKDMTPELLSNFDLEGVPIESCVIGRQRYNKGAYAVSSLRGLNDELKNKRYPDCSINMAWKKRLPMDVLTSRTFRYDFESTLTKFTEEQGDNYWQLK